MAGGPPRGGPPHPGNPRLNPRHDNLAGGPGPEFNQTPRKKGTSDRNLDPRMSQYSASVYSANSSPNSSPELAQMPTFADMQATLRRNNSNGRTPKRASSYYAENPFMDNIPEHPDEHRRSRSSSASSGQFSVYRPEKGGIISPFDGKPKGLDGIISGSNTLDEGLLRQASLGKRQKAALTNVRKSEHKSIAPSVRVQDEVDSPPMAAIESFQPGAPRQAAFANPLMPAPLSPSRANANSSPRHGHFPSDEKKPVYQERSVKMPSPKPGGSWPLRSPAVPNQAKSPPGPPRSRFSRDYRQGHNNSSSGEGGKLFLIPQRQKSLKDRVGDKAPSSLDMDAVRDAQARGSMTSLPGLLDRAIQMASNLERGKTSSKQSDWFGNEILKDMSTRGKSTASLNTMLDKFAFSSSVENQKNRDGSRSSGKWPRPAPLPPSGLQQSMQAPREDAHQRNRSRYDHRHPHSRRCCGMPLWVFFLILVVALVVIVLAVVLPVALIVIPNDKKAANPTCSANHPCANGGVSVPDQNGNCQCICTGNSSGSNCTMSNGAGSCVTIAIPSVPNAAIGSQLPPLINNAQSQFQIQLNATSVLTAFSIADTNCDLQNSLVSFTRSANRRRHIGMALPDNATPASTDPSKPFLTEPPSSPHHARSLHQHEPRQDQETTQGGIIIAGSATSTPSAAQPTSSASVGPPPLQYTDPSHVNFAKTAILYALQVSQQLSVAVTAGQKLQPYFDGLGGATGDPHNVDMGNGWSLDLVDLKVTGQGKSSGGGADQATNPGNP